MLRKARADCPELEDIVRRVVAASDPSRIVLFGSAARGERGPDSDLDLLVIVDRDVRRGRLTGEIYRRLYGVRTPVDVVVISEEDALRHSETPGLVIGPALAEGEVVYERDQAPAA